MIAAGQQVGGYTIQRRIGGGVMGDVFLASHRRIQRRAAIKILIPELSAKDGILERFVKQVRQASLLTHPSIVEILDCDLHEEQAYVVMEFLHGESLGTYLKRNGTLGGDMAFLLGMVAQVASAVGAAHAAGIMHRGLKPENIYLHLGPPPSTAVSVKVLDFGVAQLSRDDSGRSRTTLGMILGKPEYLSPEQCRGVGRPDERSDIYALGCVFYEALCGQPPFVARSPAEVITAQVTAPLRPPSKLVPDLPPKLNALLVKMLAKSPDERPGAMSEIVETLRACTRAMGIDFEGALEPVVPVERPDVYGSAPVAEPEPSRPRAESAPTRAASLVPGVYGSRVAGVRAGTPPRAATLIPSVLDDRPAAELPAPAPQAVSIAPGEPGLAPEPLPTSGSAPARPGSVARLADMMAATARSAGEELAFAPRKSDTVPRTRLMDDEEPPATRAEAATTSPATGRRTVIAFATTPDPARPQEVVRAPLSLNELAASAVPVERRPGSGDAELNALAGLAGGTQVLKPSGSGNAELDALAGLAGGTQVLKPSHPRPARGATPRRLSSAESLSAPSAEEPPAQRSGPTPARTRTLVIGRAARLWRQRPALTLGLAGVGTVLAILLVATLFSDRRSSGRGSSPARNSTAAETEPALGVVPPTPDPAPVPRAPSVPAAVGGPPHAKLAAADAARAEGRGIQARTAPSLDGRTTPVSLLVPRDSASRRKILPTSDGPEPARELGFADEVVKDRAADGHQKAASIAPAGGPVSSPPPPPMPVSPAAAAPRNEGDPITDL